MKEKIEKRIKELEEALDKHKNNEIFSHNQVIGIGAAVSELKKVLEIENANK